MKILPKAVVTLVMACVCHFGYASELEDDLRSMWEAMWTQTGYPLPLSRWELPKGSALKIRLTGFDVNGQRTDALKALEEVTTAAGLSFVDISTEPGAEKNAQITIEFLSPLTTSTELGSQLACAAFPKRNDVSNAIEFVRILVKNGQAGTCMHHELMHAMGIPGHPSGKSILSYFPWRQDQLSDFDRKLLRAWYSPRVRSQLFPFEALGPLTVEMIASQSPSTFEEYRPRERVRVKFVRSVISEMESFANGQGEIPPIILRSGLTSSQAVNKAKAEIAFNLGFTYQSGALVTADIGQAIQWFETAASQGHLYAHALLIDIYGNENSLQKDLIKAYQWTALLGTQIDSPKIKEALEMQRALLTTEQLKEAQDKVAAFVYRTPS